MGILDLLGFDSGRQVVTEQKVSSVAPLVYLMYQGQTRGVWTKRNFAQYSDDAYKRCVVAFKCINLISRGAAKIPWVVKRGADSRGRGGTALPDNHPLVKLLRKPNPFSSDAWFRESVVAYLLISGNTYIEGISGEGSKEPVELWSHRPDRMKVVPSKYGPAGYTYELNGDIRHWDIDPIDGAGPLLHMKFFNPLDDWYGMSPIEAAAYSVDAHNMSGEWNQALLQNGARPSGAMVYKPGNGAPPNLSEKQREAIKEQLNAAQVGTRNAGRPLLLDGGLEWQQMSLTPAEMDWIAGKNNSAREICMAFDVPPMILGIPGDNTYSNYKEARQALYQDTIIPLNDSLLDGLNSWLCPLYGEDIKIVQEIDDLPALAEVREARWKTVKDSDWLTINEKRAASGLDEIKSEQADTILVPSTMIPLEVVAGDDGDETITGGEDESVRAAGTGNQEGEDSQGQEDEESQAGAAQASGVLTALTSQVQSTALNGAQIQALVQIIQSVADGSMTPEVAEEVVRISFPNVAESAVARLRAAIDKLKIKPKPTVPPQPAQPPPAPPKPGQSPKV